MKENLFKLVRFSVFGVPLAGLIPIEGTDVWYSQFLGLMSLLMIGLSIALWKFNKGFSVFGLVCLFSSMVVANQSPKSLITLIQIYLAFLAIYAISRFEKDQRKALIRAVLVLVSIQGVWVILQALNLDPIFNLMGNPNKDDTVGISGSHNQLGLFFAMTAPIVLLNAIYLLPFTLVGLWFSTTATAWIGFVVFLIFWISIKLKSKAAVYLLFFGLMVCLISGFNRISDIVKTERFNLWRSSIDQVLSGRAIIKQADLSRLNGKEKIEYISIKEINCNPLFGFGLGNFIRISPHTQEYVTFAHRYEHAHNDYVEALFELGITGFLFLMVMIGKFLRDFFYAQRTKLLTSVFLAIVVQMVCAMGVYTIQTAISGMLMILFLGLFYGELRDQRWEDQNGKIAPVGERTATQLRDLRLVVS